MDMNQKNSKIKVVSNDTKSEVPVHITKEMSLSSALSKKPYIIKNIEDDYIEVTIGLSNESQNNVHELCKKLNIDEEEFTEHIIDEMMTEEFNKRKTEYDKMNEIFWESKRNQLSLELLTGKHSMQNIVCCIEYEQDEVLDYDKQKLLQRQLANLSSMLSKMNLVSVDICDDNLAMYFIDKDSEPYVLYENRWNGFGVSFTLYNLTNFKY